ncbi:MAG: hypothetical protein EHM45_14090 [Desulfobacteraceae bacterium]|nr:MAG: hypothetical protein EHM45_14090 [Desulfobacteraceae bacterium]
MTAIRHIVLLNQCLKRHMLGLSAKEKERLREKIEFLEAGIWDAGVRVKKLKGLSQKVVFEARLSKGDRLLFTLGKQGPHTAVYIWGLVKHDDVSKNAQFIFPENAPFLHFEPQAVEEHNELLLDEIPPDYFSQEAVEEKSPEDYQPQKWLVLREEDWKRMLLTDDPDRLELFLSLTPEQAGILETPPPVLISGTAGSGKTTLAVYYLLKKKWRDKKKLFLTHNRLLNEFSKKIHLGLVYKTENDPGASVPDFYVFRDLLWELVGPANPLYDENKEVDLRRFLSIYRNHRFFQKYDGELVWEEIRSIIKGAKPWIRTDRFKRLLQAYLRDQMPPADLPELKEFLLNLNPFHFLDKIEKALASKTAYRRLNDFIKNMPTGGPLPDGHCAALNELLRIVEKNEKAFFTPLLTYQEYLDLGRKRAPNFLYERKDLYDIAEYYQDKLQAQGGWDEIDLCRQALRNLEKNRDERFEYDLVVCDEVQDFTDIQTALIFHLARSPRAVVLAGDPKQIINPSGFRWEEVKQKFYERGLETPPVVYLKLNFRCVGNIVKLANALLDLKQRLVGLVSSEFREEWKFNGKPPFLLENLAEEEILESLRPRAADQIILVRDKTEQKKLKTALATELVFTIHEAKGLEFDTVFLWKFTADPKSVDLWRSIRNNDSFDRSDHPHIRHEINLLYVAITRARQRLIIFDPRTEIWDLPSLSAHVYRTMEKEALSEVWRRTSNPEEWRKQGDYFFERAYYAAAAECYRNAGDPARRETAEAFVLEGKRQFQTAALLFTKYGLRRKAAECREQAGDFGEAAGLWKELNEPDRAALCEIRLYDQKGDYNKAAEEWCKRGEFSKAIECWSRAGNHRKMGEYYFGRKQYDRAAEAFEKAGAWGPAGACFQKMKKTDKAADLYYRAGLWSEAIPLLKKTKHHDKLKDCYIRCRDYYNAALLCEKAAETDQAIALLREFQKQSLDHRDRLATEAEEFLKKRRKNRAAVRYSALGMFDRSAPLHFEQDRIDTALAEFEALGDHERIAECHFRRNDFYQAALVYESISADDKWKNATNMFELHIDNLGKDREKKETQLYREADDCFAKSLFDSALARYKALHDFVKIRDTYLHLDRDEEALDYFLNGNRFQDAHRYLEKKTDPNVSAAYLNSLILHRKGYARYDDSRDEDLDFCARLLLVLLKKQETPELLALIDRFLSLHYFNLFHKKTVPDYIFDLVLTSRNANTILEMLKFASFDKHSRKLLKSFPVALKKRAEESGDPVLLACHLFREDRSRFEELIADMTPSPTDYRLFIESPHFRKAVDFLMEINKIEAAAGACRYHGRFDLAARIYENTGNIAWAARDYRDGKHYEDALRCCRKIGDESGIARIHERKMEFEQAMAIWKKLGKSREIQRLSKKLDKLKIKTDDTQRRLF